MHRLTGALVAALLLFASLPALASVTTARSLADLVREAEDVVVVEALDENSHYDTRGRIVTDVRLRVRETMKGSHSSGDELMVRVLGGAVGDIGMRIEGEPTFAVGQRSVLFAKTAGAHLRPVGMSQGVLPILEHAGVDFVTPGGAGLHLVQRSGTQLIDAPAALLQPRELPSFLDELRALVAAQ